MYSGCINLIIGVGNAKEQCQIKDHNNVTVYILLEYFTTELLNECPTNYDLIFIMPHKFTPTAHTYIRIHSVYTIYAEILEGLIFCKSERIFIVNFLLITKLNTLFHATASL